MRSLLLALFVLPLVSFAQDSLNVTRLSEINLALGPELCHFALSGNYIFAPE